MTISEVSCRGSDWIELTNPAHAAVTLDGWRISDRDDPSDDHGADLPPGLRLGPGEYVVLYRDRDFSFGIRCGEEAVHLFDVDGQLADRMALPALHGSQTWGLRPSGKGQSGVLIPTAGAPNEEPVRFLEDEGSPTDGPPGSGAGPCHDAGIAAGALVCRDTFVTLEDFQRLSVTDTFSHVVERVTKYTLPVSGSGNGLPALVQNVNLYPLHREFLVAVFPERFSGLGPEAYEDLVSRRATREYWSGALYRFLDTGTYGFSVITDPADEKEALDQAELAAVQAGIGTLTQTPDPAWVPLYQADLERALTWESPPFPIRPLAGSSDQDLRVYTPGTGYGWVRIMDLDALDASLAAGTLGWTDLVVLAGVPVDLETVVAGVVTATPQTELSHLALRTGLRNTPNLYHHDAMDLFAPWEGRLVRLDAYADAFTVDDQVTLEEAETWWAANRPAVNATQDLDLDFEGMPGLREVVSSTPEARRQLFRRFGGKAAQLAILYSLLPVENQVEGFMVPFSWYERFLDENGIQTDGASLSYRAYLESVATSTALMADAAGRRAALDTLRDHAVTQGSLPAGLEEALRLRIVEVFGDERVMVRFRSSSSAEDSLAFSGAGLYESESACAADTFDDDQALPSRCDPNTGAEKTLRDALVTVWSSLWSFRAWEERAWFQMDQTRVSMAVLVNARQVHETANGVLFTGIPGSPEDPHYLVNAQWMDVEVVRPEPGLEPERDRLNPEVEGDAAVERWGRSSLLPEGNVVLRDADLVSLSRLVSDLEEDFPLDDLGDHAREDVRLDLEWKLERDGGLLIKQVRPWVPTQIPVPDGIILLTPVDRPLCSTFVDDRAIWRERELQARVHLVPGQRVLSFDGDDYPIIESWVQQFEYGPDGDVLKATGPGVFTLEKTTTWQDTYSFRYVQGFEGSAGTVSFEWTTHVGSPEGEAPAGRVVSVGGEAQGFRGCLQGCEKAADTVPLQPCRLDWLDTWRHVAVFPDPAAPFAEVEIRMRHRPDPVESGPVALVQAELRRTGQDPMRVDGAFDLVYAARRHNESEDFLVRFEATDGQTAYLLLDEPGSFDPDPVVTLSVLDPDLVVTSVFTTGDFEKEVVQ